MSGDVMEETIQATERHLGVELPYLRDIVRVAPDLLARLGAINGAAEYTRHAPTDVRHLAALGATSAQDCGACVQIGVNLSLKDGVDAGVLRAALGLGGGTTLTEDQADAFAFGRAVTLQDPAMVALRERIRARHGDAGLVSVAWALSMAQFYPVLKRSLGYAEACSVYGVTVEA